MVIVRKILSVSFVSFESREHYKFNCQLLCDLSLWEISTWPSVHDNSAFSTTRNRSGFLKTLSNVEIGENGAFFKHTNVTMIMCACSNIYLVFLTERTQWQNECACTSRVTNLTRRNGGIIKIPIVCFRFTGIGPNQNR